VGASNLQNNPISITHHIEHPNFFFFFLQEEKTKKCNETLSFNKQKAHEPPAGGSSKPKSES
jgi:hypothetical protein